MVHKVNLNNVDVKAVLIVGTPTEDLNKPEKATEQKETDFYDDLDESMTEFTDSLSGKDKKDKPLVAESAL